MGYALPGVPKWTSIPRCRQHGEGSGAVRMLSSSAVPGERAVSPGQRPFIARGWQVTVGATRLLGGLEGYGELNQRCPR